MHTIFQLQHHQCIEAEEYVKHGYLQQQENETPKSLTQTSKDAAGANVSLQESKAQWWSVKNHSVLSVTERGLFTQVRK